MTSPDVCVIFNPRAGRDRAGGRLQRLRTVLGPRALFQPTQATGHAEELAFEAARAGFAVVAAAGGDGTVHEVANGILRAGRPEVVLEVYPVGSANDYAHSLGLDPDWKLRGDPRVQARAVDVGMVQGGTGRQRYFINNLGLGFNGQVTRESQRIRFLQGRLLYNLALLRALVLRFEAPPMTVTLDGTPRQAPTLALSVSIGRREGNFLLAPEAVVDDGLFDYLHAGPLSRWELIRNLLRLNTGHLPNHPLLWRGRCRSVQVASATPLPIHLDGELFDRPGEDVREIDVTLLPGALRVMASSSAAITAAPSEPPRKRILFVCVENSNRSQMAEAFARIHGAGKVEAYSAGSRPSGRVNPRAVEFMREVGYDLSTHRSKALSEVPAGEFDVVVGMGCGDEGCAAVPARRHEEWGAPDPKELPPEGYRQVRDLIEARVKELLARL